MCATFLHRSAGLTGGVLLLHLLDGVFPPLRELVGLQEGPVDGLRRFICRSLEGKGVLEVGCGAEAAWAQNQLFSWSPRWEDSVLLTHLHRLGLGPLFIERFQLLFGLQVLLLYSQRKRL